MIFMMGLALVLTVDAQQPPTGGQRGAQPAGTPQRGGRGGRGNRGAFQAMTVVTTSWPDGGQIPLKYTQAGAETSPGVQWSNVPANTASFVLLFRDLDTVTGQTMEPLIHWMLWNIPANVTQIQPNRPDGRQWEDGTRQISASGFRYRGPGASSTGPMHHYVLEVYALDTMLDVQHAPQSPGGVSPAIATRDAVFQAMAGHIRGKGAYIGLFRRPQ
jgi:Raf kinase inhibitor-like YbhB/YbcL family protein